MLCGWSNIGKEEGHFVKRKLVELGRRKKKGNKEKLVAMVGGAIKEKRERWWSSVQKCKRDRSFHAFLNFIW